MQIRVFKIPLNDAVPAHRSEHEDVTRNITEEQKKLYTQFCSIRSRLAKEQNIAHYLVFNNKELAALAMLPELTEESLLKVKGVNKKRLSSFGHFFIAQADGETSGISDAADSQSGESEGGVLEGGFVP